MSMRIEEYLVYAAFCITKKCSINSHLHGEVDESLGRQRERVHVPTGDAADDGAGKGGDVDRVEEGGRGAAGARVAGARAARSVGPARVGRARHVLLVRRLEHLLLAGDGVGLGFGLRHLD